MGDTNKVCIHSTGCDAVLKGDIVQIINGKIGLDVQLENHGYDCDIKPRVANGCCPRNSTEVREPAYVSVTPKKPERPVSTILERKPPSPKEEHARCVSVVPKKSEKPASAVLNRRSPSPKEETCGVACCSTKRYVNSSQTSIHRSDCCKYYVRCQHDNYENGPFIFETPKPCRKKF